ncbi:MAG: MarR family winged helix-turn-helix transcriptional regulator [Thiohalocapsa sp.]|nr:MarR family winged helix-turn-helix transcriptional regulator [Thiohalocapsa sp.]MCF7989535.1 MarR family winged helix-turn-helix transcriptional regulator [Thiohalocapsa sp.]
MTTSTTAPQIEDYLERLCNLLRAQARTVGAEYGLLPVQLEALRYLSICNRYSDTPLAVADYLGQTKGSVSQTIKTLEAKDMLTKTRDQADRRVVHLAITDRGHEVLAVVLPRAFLREAVEVLGNSAQDRLRDGLDALLRSVQQANGLRTFGPCQTCRYHRRNAGGLQCELTGEQLNDDDRTRICREHEFAQG